MKRLVPVLLASVILIAFSIGAIPADDEVPAIDPLEGLSDNLLSYKTPQFTVYSDSVKIKYDENVIQKLDLLFSHLDSIWPEGEAPAMDPARRIRLFVASRKSLFYQLCIAIDPAGPCSDIEGFYIPGHRVLSYHASAFTTEETNATMFHEGAHAYLDARVAQGDVLFPTWLNEGLAYYTSNSRFKRGKLDFGKFCDRTAYHTPYGPRRGLSMAEEMWRSARKEIRKNADLRSLSALLTQHPGKPGHGRNRELYLTRSWILVVFLRDSRSEWRDSAFPGFLTAVGAGMDVKAAMEQFYGKPMTEMETLFDEFLRSYHNGRCQ